MAMATLISVPFLLAIQNPQIYNPAPVYPGAGRGAAGADGHAFDYVVSKISGVQ
jgi:hypothetical protein